MNFAVSADHTVKMRESEKIDKYLNLTWEPKQKQNNPPQKKNKKTNPKPVEHEGDSDTYFIWRA